MQQKLFSSPKLDEFLKKMINSTRRGLFSKEVATDIIEDVREILNEQSDTIFNFSKKILEENLDKYHKNLIRIAINTCIAALVVGIIIGLIIGSIWM